MFVAAALFVLGLLPQGAQQARPERPPEIEALIDLARAVPVEFQADVLLRLIDSPRIADPKWKRELLEDLFVFAGRAKHSLPRRDVIGVYTDTDANRMESAHNLRLDALSIRCRVVKAMLALDIARARELLAQMPPIEIAPSLCADPLVPDVSLFYETVREVLDRSFSPQERKREDHIAFARSYIGGISSSLQLAPAAQLVAQLRATPDQRRELLGAFQSAMAGLSDNDRAFSYAMRNLPEQVERLAAEAKRDGVAVDSLVHAYRGFVVKHLRAPRCADTVAREKQWASVRDYVKAFDEKLRPLAKSEMPSISPEEREPVKVEGEPDPGVHWRSQEAKALLQGLRELPREDKPLTAHEIAAFETYSEIRAYLSRLDSWEADEDARGAWFHEKCGLYHSLIGQVPAGPLLESAIRGYAVFLSQSPMQRDEPAVWLWHFNSLLRYTRKMTETERADLEKSQKLGIRIPGLPIESGPIILRELKASNDPVLALYANLEALVPKSFGDWRRPE